jgi:hypothetical protein
MSFFSWKSPALLLVSVCVSPTVDAQEYLNGIQWVKPLVIQPGKSDDAPPSDATVLFDGTDASAWSNSEKWTVADGSLVCGSGVIQTKQEFGDCQLHIEWSAPTPAKGSGQGRGNSGVFMMGRYEIQVLDSYDNETYSDGQAGAIYKQTPPMVNAMRAPGEWNTYDIFWTAPRFAEDGSLKSPAYVTLVHNGVLALNHFELLGDTPYHRPPQYEAHPSTGPITLQDHGNPVRFRNIWIREIKPAQGELVREPFIRQGDKEIPISQTK